MTTPSTSAETLQQSELTSDDSIRFSKAADAFLSEYLNPNPDLGSVFHAFRKGAEYATLHERAAAKARIEQLQKHLNETDDALHVTINLRKYDVKKLDEAHDKNLDLLRENALLSADRDLWKDRYGKLVVEARHADEDEMKGMRYSIEYQALQIKQLKEALLAASAQVHRIDELEEWLTEYRDQLKKENAYHKNTGIINAINELLNGE